MENADYKKKLDALYNLAFEQKDVHTCLAVLFEMDKSRTKDTSPKKH